MTTTDIPFIHCIKTPVGLYVYDVNTNKFLTIENEELYSVLESLEQGFVLDSLQHHLDEIKELQEEGYLSSSHPEEMQHPMLEMLPFELNKNIKQMTLQLTQQCNFRCDYCTYKPKDFHYQRQHTNKNMSWETARDAVDFFLLHSIHQTEPIIGFYGGEPLLQFHLLKDIVIYAEKEFCGKSINFTVTTNGSLLNSDVASFLDEHNFSVLISLDGPPEIHNRSRKFASNGSGTFQNIEDNLTLIKQKFPELYKSIMFNVVVDNRFSCNDVHNHFNGGLFQDAMILSTLIEDFFTMEKYCASDQFMKELYMHQFIGLLSMIGKYSSESVSRLTLKEMRDLDDRLRRNFEHLHINKKMSHSGPCIPGQRRLFVTVDGDFMPCERVSEASPIMKIGSIKTGIDIKAAEDLLNIVSLTPDECKNCWAIMHCTTCAKFCDNGGAFSKELKLNRCQEVKNSVEHDFRQYLLKRELSLEGDE